MYKFNDKYFTKKVSVYVVPVLRWLKYMFCMEVRDGVVGWETALQAESSRVRFPMVSIEIFHWLNPSGRTMALESTKPLTEMSTSNISWG